MHPADVVALAFDYPTPTSLASLSAAVEESLHGVVQRHLRSFVTEIEPLDLGRWEELHTATLDLSPLFVPYVGHVTWGDNYRRGAFMADLKGAMAAAAVDLGGELPDHLSPILRYLASGPVPLPDLVEVLPAAVADMHKTLVAAAPDNPYRHVLAATVALTADLRPVTIGEASMTGNTLLFGVVPYVAAALALVVTVVRWRRHPFSVSSLSSQLLESRKLYWGSIPFHWGLSLILVGHLLALIVPRGFEIWNGAPLRLYLLEITGLALGLWSGFGIAVLIYRRLSEPRVWRVTSVMDLVVLAVVAVQIISGVWIAIGYRWGSYWGTAVFVPYLRSLLSFQPEPAYVEPLPLMLKIHALAFFAFLAIFPFTRLVHIITLPVQYLFRPWQKVTADRHPPHPSLVTGRSR